MHGTGAGTWIIHEWSFAQMPTFLDPLVFAEAIQLALANELLVGRKWVASKLEHLVASVNLSGTAVTSLLCDSYN